MLSAQRSVFALALLAIAPTLGCGASPASEGPSKRTSARIVNGVLDVDHPAPLGDVDEGVVSISWADASGNGFGCTGSLVGPRVVLTARHCVSNCEGTSADPYYGCTTDYDLSGYQFSTGYDTTPASATWAAKAIKIVHDSSNTILNHDLALIELDQPVGSRVVSIRLAAPPTAGEAVRAVGYGLTNDAMHLNTDGYPYRYRRDGLTILGLGPDPANQVFVNELLLGESICDGDSGGPILDATSGAIVGTVSRGGNNTNNTGYLGCVDTDADVASNVYTRVDKFQALITQALADVGETPTPEGSTMPSPPPPSTDAGVDAAAPDDTGAAPGDDAATTDPAADAATTTTANAADAKSSGGCSASGSGAGALGALPFALVALAITRRRASRR